MKTNQELIPFSVIFNTLFQTHFHLCQFSIILATQQIVNTLLLIVP